MGAHAEGVQVVLNGEAGVMSMKLQILCVALTIVLCGFVFIGHWRNPELTEMQALQRWWPQCVAALVFAFASHWLNREA